MKQCRLVAGPWVSSCPLVNWIGKNESEICEEVLPEKRELWKKP